MEDTQDKVRRNLVVFSAAIVIGWFLDLKLTAITKLFAAADIDNVDIGRLWIVTLAVLIYLFLRYRFDAPTSSQIRSLSIELKEQKRNYLLKYLLRKIKRINRTGKFPPVFSSSVAETVNRKKEELQKEHSRNFSSRLSIGHPWSSEGSPVDFGESNTMWTGTVGISEEYFTEGSSRSFMTSSGQSHDFSVPLHGRAWITAHSCIHVMLYSKSAVDLIVPVILAGIASLITISNLISIFELSKT